MSMPTRQINRPKANKQSPSAQNQNPTQVVYKKTSEGRDMKILVRVVIAVVAIVALICGMVIYFSFQSNIHERDREIVLARIYEISKNSDSTGDFDGGIAALKNLLIEYPVFSTEINAEIATHMTYLLRTVKFTLDRSDVTISLGDTTTLSVSSNPANIRNIETVWSSANTSVVTINSAGQISAQGAGTTQVFLSASDGTVLATSDVTVFLPPTSIGNLFFDGGGTVSGGWQVRTNVSNGQQIVMGGVTHENAVVFSARSATHTWGVATVNTFALHNLQGQYRSLYGYIGRVDGHNIQDAIIRIIGDDRVLQEFELSSRDLQRTISLGIEGISLLRVEVTHTNRSNTRQEFAFVGFVDAHHSPNQIITPPTTTAQPMAIGDLFFDGRGIVNGGWNVRTSVTTGESVVMGGISHNNAVLLATRSSTHTWGAASVEIFALHNLQGRYRLVTGHIGRVDGTNIVDATVRIIGDERVLQEFQVPDLPMVLSLNVEGINLLRVEIAHTNRSNTRQEFAIVGVAE